MLKQSGKRSVERAIAGPEPRKGQNSLTTQFLHQTTLREDNAEHITKGRKCYEDGESTFGLWTEHIAEQGRSDQALRRDDLMSRDCSEVCNLNMLAGSLVEVGVILLH